MHYINRSACHSFTFKIKPLHKITTAKELELFTCNRMMLLLLLLINIVFSTDGNGEIVPINTSRELEEYLCHNYDESFITLILRSSSYNISHGNFCEIRRNIVIRSASNESVLITCQAKDSLLQAFLFSGCSVTIENLHFNNCGTYLRTIKNHKINASHLYYNTDRAAALVVIDSHLVLTNVMFTSSFGFSIIGINLKDSTMNGVTVNKSDAFSIFHKRVEAVGTGIVVHFMHTGEDHNAHRVVLYNCTFSYNTYFSNESACIGEVYNSINRWHCPLINGVGLTIVYTHSNAYAEVIIDGAHFFENTGYSTGALVIVQFDDNSTAQTTIKNTKFLKNKNSLNRCYGAAVGYYMYLNSTNSHDRSESRHESLTISNTRFMKNSKFLIGSAVVYLAISNPTNSDIKITFKNCTWIHSTGACLYAYVLKSMGNVSIHLDNTTVSDNSQAIHYNNEQSSSGILAFHEISHVYINGTSTFNNNYGSTILAINSNIYLLDSIKFIDNAGLEGSAITILEHSLLYFKNGLEAVFKNNTAAYKGGAIYAVTLSPKLCALQLEGNVTLNFTDNDAKKSGKSIYATPIFSCQNAAIIYSAFIDNDSDFEISFSSNHMHNKTLLDVSTYATRLQDCDLPGSDEWNANAITFYPGQTHQLNLAANDEHKRHVYAPLSIDVVTPQIWIQSEQAEYILAEGKCTVVTITIYSVTEEVRGGVVVFSIPKHLFMHEHIMIAMKCPLGFLFNSTTGQCECSQVKSILQMLHNTQHIECHIDNQTITRPIIDHRLHWMGLLEIDLMKLGLGVSLDCPNRYCEINPMFDSFYTNLSEIIYLTASAAPSLKVPQCLFNRGGTLCGECTGNLSVVFGSNKCMKCPNYQWIWVTILNIAFGPLLIFLLFKLQLTMTIGTLNGIIFYAQAANAGMLDILYLCTTNICSTGLYYAVQISIFFLSTLNLNLGFPLCFYNGMTELWKAGLNLLFPIYLFAIVIIIIIASRYSIRISNRISHSSVQVLVTVLHLSFSKLLLAVMDVLTSTYIYTNKASYRVWYWNGNVEFGKSGHLILMIVTLAIALPLLLPYVFILIFSRPLQRFSLANKYLRPVIESVHSPYKQGQQYWFAARLILLVIMYFIYMGYRGVEAIVTATPLLVAFVILQSFAKPFKNTLINLLDLWVMYNILFLYTTVCYFIVEVKYEEASVFVTVGTFLTLGTAVLIIVYHILLAFALVHTLRGKLISVLVSISAKAWFNSSRNYDTYMHREPLLNSNFD